MRITHLRRIGLAAFFAFCLALGFGQTAQADSAAADVTFSVDQASVTPGSAVTVTMTFTNNQATDIWFVYQSMQPTWATTQRPDLKFAFGACSGTGVTCTGAGTTALTFSYAVPVAPGQTRTVTLPVDVAADSGCNGNIAFDSYVYYEYDEGRGKKDGIFTTPTTRVVCAP
ncbi:hypothetical protein [Streptomyces sp. NPDC059063]|uniref:hypothetical protein n=1 Tax=unclassified Streptomyces TaxID=2593676 RepID=UPI00367973EE